MVRGRIKDPLFVALSATPQLSLPKRHIHPWYDVNLILNSLRGVFNTEVNRLRKYVKGRNKMNYFEVVDQGVGLHCS